MFIYVCMYVCMYRAWLAYWATAPLGWATFLFLPQTTQVGSFIHTYIHNTYTHLQSNQYPNRPTLYTYCLLHLRNPLIIKWFADTIVAARSASATRPDRIDRVFGLYPNKNKNNNNSNRSLSSSSSSGLGEKMRSFINYELKPLRDIVLAIQMNSKFLPDFVKTELYKGAYLILASATTPLLQLLPLLIPLLLLLLPSHCNY